MVLTETQKNFILKFFVNEEYAGWSHIANKLIDKGECIVAGDKCLWYGGVGNFIRTYEAYDYYGCMKYTFNLDEFIKSKYFIENLKSELNKTNNELNIIEKKHRELTHLLD